MPKKNNNQTEKITITIKIMNWKTLKSLGLKKDLRTHDQVLEFLFKKARIN